MPHSVQYNAAEDIIEAHIQGKTGVPELTEAMREIFRNAAWEGCPRILTDLREADLDLTTIEIYHLPEIVKQEAETASLKIYHIKRAYVVRQNQDMDFYEDVSVNRGHNVKVFQDSTKARQWLLH